MAKAAGAYSARVPNFQERGERRRDCAAKGKLTRDPLVYLSLALSVDTVPLF